MEVLRVLGSRQITSLLVEGGAAVHGAFLKAGLVDQLQFFYAPLIGGDGGTSVIDGFRVSGDREDAIRLVNISHRRLDDDLLISGDVVFPSNKD